MEILKHLFFAFGIPLIIIVVLAIIIIATGADFNTKRSRWMLVSWLSNTALISLFILRYANLFTVKEPYFLIYVIISVLIQAVSIKGLFHKE